MQQLHPAQAIDTTHIMKILNKSYKSAWQKMSYAKEHFNKKKHQILTIKEFCEYAGINIEETIQLLTSKNSNNSN